MKWLAGVYGSIRADRIVSLHLMGESGLCAIRANLRTEAIHSRRNPGFLVVRDFLDQINITECMEDIVTRLEATNGPTLVNPRPESYFEKRGS